MKAPADYVLYEHTSMKRRARFAFERDFRMSTEGEAANVGRVSVSLVDGDADVRHARQLMLRSEDYDVSSYATCSGLLADPTSQNDSCIVVDVSMRDGDGLKFLREMRANGWHGHAILLDGKNPTGKLAREASLHGDQVHDRDIGDRQLALAVAALASMKFPLPS